MVTYLAWNCPLLEIFHMPSILDKYIRRLDCRRRQTNELRILVNRDARVTTGCFRTTNHSALSTESGLRRATAQLENRQRRFGVLLLSLPPGDQAREIVGASTTIGRRLMEALAYAGRTERTVLLEEPETLDAGLLQEEEAEAKGEAEKS